MALWTPYSELALDLTKSSVVKREARYPCLESPQYPHPLYASPDRGTPPQHAGFAVAAYYSHAPPAVPSPQLSPDSASSSWSSPSLYPSVVPVALSPSDTPDYEQDSLEDDLEYQAFERDALRAIAEKNGGSLVGNNPRMRRAVAGAEAADASYRQQRARNNAAAKQSRDRRKLRELRLAFQVSFLKKKVAELRARLQCPTCRYTC